MYPPGPYGTPLPSFRFPVDPPVGGPGDPPLYQVCINKDWVPFIIGALKQLSLQSTWNYASDADLLTVQGRVFDLMSQFALNEPGCNEPTPSKLCLSGTFGDLDYGYRDFGGGICSAVYVGGTGWESCYDSANSQDILYLQRDFSPTQIDSYEFNLSYSGAPRLGVAHVKFYRSGVLQRDDSFTTVLGTVLFLSSSTPVFCDRIEITSSFGTNSVSVPYYATDFKMCYTGVFPLATNDTWTHTFDFTTSDNSWIPWPAAVYSGSDGSYSLGTGFVDGDGQLGGPGNYYRSVLIQRTFTANITRVSFVFDRSAISTNQVHANLFTLITNVDGSHVFASQDVDASQIGTNLTFVWSGVASVTGLTLQVVSSYWDSAGHEAGTDIIRSVTISGYGPDPF